MLNTKQDIADFIQHDDYMMQALKVAKTCNLPNWFIGAGFVRDTIWNIQHGITLDYKYKDLDLGYFDHTNMSEKSDIALSFSLKEKFDVNWEIVNQAYAHKYNNVEPYKSATDGLAHWVKTATCVAATLDKNDNVKIIAPWGVDDLLNLKLRIAPCHTGNKFYETLFLERVKNKQWLERWPKLELIIL